MRFGWGVRAVAAFADDCAAIVIVDVLSFSTAVDVATAGGATVMPYRMSDATAAAFAAEREAVLAVARGETSPAQPFTLSPQSMAAAGPGDRIVLPSPNGATLCMAAAGSGASLIVGCLRNASAVAAAAAEYRPPIGVVAAGERWPDGSLRPALEDLLGAGAVLQHLDPHGMAPEATIAARSFPHPAEVAALVAGSVSGRELADRGYAGDVTVAVEIDAGDNVPALRNGEIRATVS